MSYHIVL